jgi:hypothetical protein
VKSAETKARAVAKLRATRAARHTSRSIEPAGRASVPNGPRADAIGHAPKAEAAGNVLRTSIGSAGVD